MSQNEKEQFEQSFQNAVKASLRSGRASDGVRARLLQSLASPPIPVPAGLDQLERFDGALAQAVANSQEWAVDDAVAWRVESALGQEAGRDLLSERSVHQSRLASTGSSEQSRAKFLRQLCLSVEKSQQTVLAPAACRRRIEAALATAGVPASLKVVPISKRPTRPRAYWKRGLAAVASLAASAALVFGLFFGGAEQALAESVRQDHQRCCSALKGKQAQRCASFNSDTYGPLPDLSIAPGWVLVASKMCRDSEGQPMVHNVYNRDGKIISIHLIPPATDSSKANSQPREIANGDFPVLAWETSGWTVTACSSDVDMGMLASAVEAR